MGTSAETQKERKKLSFTTQVVLGVLLGILVGLFFGESIGGIGVVGTAYVRLLQMTILPYIMVSLIHGFGCLTRQQAVKVAPRLALIMIIFWVTGLSLVMAMPLVFPDRSSANFFNPSVLQHSERPSFLDMFIPANPFEALASGTIPAVVLFSILFGIALMGLKGKDGLLLNINLVTQALTRVTMMVVKITPIGVFAMTASAAGTMDISEFARLQVYFTSYIGGCLFLTFIAFPALVNIFTPFQYRQVLRKYRGALVMAFTTGNLFVVLPLLMEQTKELFLESQDNSEGEEYVDILIPVAFNFPNMGKLIALLFVLFGAWFVGSPIPTSTYPSFLATGWLTFFGGIDLALPFMLQLTGLPSDLFSVYSVSGVINGRFATLLACMELISITLITGTWLAGPTGLKIKITKLCTRAIAVILLAALMLYSMRIYLDHAVPSAEDHSERLWSMSLPFPAEIDVHPESEGLPSGKNGLFSIFESSDQESILRVGYSADDPPFSYTNVDGDLVGYDVELVCRLARDLDLQLEFYPLSSTDEMEEALLENRLDVAISGVTLSGSQIRDLGFSVPYQQLVLGAVVSKEFKKHYDETSRKNLRQEDLRIAMIRPNSNMEAFRLALPNSEGIEISNFTEFYEAPPGKFDALLISMEAGSALNMVYPGFTTILLEGGQLKTEMVFACNPGNLELIRYLNDWIRLQKSKGTMVDLYNYWFRGEPRASEAHESRWSIMQNVLGWGTRSQ